VYSLLSQEIHYTMVLQSKFMDNFLNTKQKLLLGLIATLFCLNIFAWQEVFALASPKYLRVDVLDIGQGDSIFIETPSRHRILIDGGPDSKVLEKLAMRLAFWNKSLDVVILTHPDQDHLMGILHVLQKYKVKHILWTGIVRDGANYQKWLELLAKKEKEGSQITITNVGTSISSGSVLMEILNPIENLEGKFFGKLGNDTGIVSRLVYGENSFLFMADVSSKVEQALIDSKIDLVSDVLKVGHHGSKYSSSEEFLQAVHPNKTVISVGKSNSYGHPTKEVLQKIQKSGINNFRTDEVGDVEFLCDEKNIVKLVN